MCKKMITSSGQKYNEPDEQQKRLNYCQRCFSPGHEAIDCPLNKKPKSHNENCGCRKALTKRIQKSIGTTEEWAHPKVYCLGWHDGYDEALIALKMSDEENFNLMNEIRLLKGKPLAKRTVK